MTKDLIKLLMDDITKTILVKTDADIWRSKIQIHILKSLIQQVSVSALQSTSYSVIPQILLESFMSHSFTDSLCVLLQKEAQNVVAVELHASVAIDYF
jgi:hypothetical protein